MNITLFKTKKSSKGRVKIGNHNSLHPHRDWTIVLTVFISLYILIMAWNIYSFIMPQSATFSSVPAVTVKGGSNAVDVAKIKKFFDGRNENNSLINSTKPLVTPITSSSTIGTSTVNNGTTGTSTLR